MQANLEKQIKELNVRIVDLETRAFAASPRPVPTSRRLESRIEELQSVDYQRPKLGTSRPPFCCRSLRRAYS